MTPLSPHNTVSEAVLQPEGFIRILLARIFLALALVNLLPAGASAHAATLRWLVAHDPSDHYVLGLVKKHAQALTSKSRKSLRVKVETLPEKSWKTPAAWIEHWKVAFQKVQDGNVDVAQIPYF